MAGNDGAPGAAQNSAAQSAADATAAPAAGANDPLIALHHTLRANRDLQFQFQDYAPQPPPPWLVPLARFLRAFGPYLQIVFWSGVFLIVALIVFVIVREAAQRWGLIEFKKNVKPEAPAAPAFKPSASRARALLEEADRLAAQGRYSEAVRVLLHRSIEDIERAYPITIGPSATSREIARLKPLSPHGRDVFGRIAQAVETSLFGERALDQARFAECRSAYATFALGKNA
jgi:hypothetical protein